MAKRRGNPVRIVIALSVAAVLAVFLLYTSIAGGTPSLQPGQLPGHRGEVSLSGRVVGPVHRDDGAGGGMRFTLRDVNGSATVPVRYRGTVPDLFRVGRDVNLRGRMAGGIFVAVPDSLVTKCPSRYAPAKPAQTR